MSTTLRRSQPRAKKTCIAPVDLIGEVRQLLVDHTVIPLHLFHMVYRVTYGRNLDCASIPIPGGLRGFLVSIGDTFELYEDTNGVDLVTLRSNPTTPDYMSPGEKLCSIARKRSNIKSEKLFTVGTPLWKNHKNLLKQDSIQVAKSGFELALECQPRQVENQIKSIRNALGNHPRGVPLPNLYRVVGIDYKLFNVATCLSDLTVELPELFFRFERDQGDSLIFDGHERTYSGLTGQISDEFLEQCSPHEIAALAFKSGLYQKTLLLLRGQRHFGLKLNVWYNSIEKNFPVEDKENDPDEIIFNLGPIVFFKSLAKLKLIEIASNPKCKNDLRIRIPRDVEPILEFAESLHGQES